MNCLIGSTESGCCSMQSIQTWLGTYNETIGMYHASVITTVFGTFCVAFFIALCWPKLVELYGAMGGLLGGGVIVGTFWVMNHKLPGLGLEMQNNPMGPEDAVHQFGLIAQGACGSAPWVDMATAVGVGMYVCSLLELRSKKKTGTIRLVGESIPRIVAVLIGGAIGGGITGLIGFTGAGLDVQQSPIPVIITTESGELNDMTHPIMVQEVSVDADTDTDADNL